MGITTSTSFNALYGTLSPSAPRYPVEGQTLLECTPIEILDHILSLLSSPNDLLSFALTSRYAHTLVIPHHLEYRIIRTVGPSVGVWSDLAIRTGRTRNIREVCIYDELSGSSRKRVPTSSVDEPLRQGHPLEMLVEALGYMHVLEVFRWHRASSGASGMSWQRQVAARDVEREGLWELEVFKVLRQLDTLKTVELVGDFSLDLPHNTIASPRQFSTNEPQVHPLWTFSQIESLKLGSYRWSAYLGNDRLSRLLTCNNIQSLDTPIDLAHLAQHAIILPHLKVLVSSLKTREYAPALLAGRGNFLATHPTIEELSWYHDSPVTFPKDGVFLPNLRRLRAHRDFVIRLVNRRGAPDELTIDCVDTRTLCLLVGLGRGIRKLVIDEIQGGTLPYLAEFNEFPNLRVLSVSRTRGGENVHFWNLNKMAEFLRSFPLIEAFQIESKGIWDIFDVPKKPSIHSLVDRCPNLRILNIQRPLYTESKSIEIKDKIGGYEVSSTGRRSLW